ncbi:bifunctional 3-(3-hydroxy-phenyl)propionate/3-hydroxycinnamic acid hydroxylase [Paraburkholderia dipogonis]|uniref:Bifunctional 3-(3-hydroxy-phenyl)propionate/3-hydroxycinnamic acid hydroxylase n=2 Tax=Paraburkholderia dipogonis TaxID=1211383 RepID=A0A4Y8MYG9_9BURK|nr:bifunctional 3-(3-hydroxy-phenyl)propionate/3-hydroxycinnamic acid hydroxylase [Paraburkholderia dipogonis]TFE42343.1 bifunctional 3-(3-hydroxy-phenyl)propionate/3-hydroxycinnamic acid hydroxylase [Paraburkholderia dipogonis]
MEKVRTSVAIVGAGPVGCTVANLLGVYGIEAMLIDRSEDILPYPRAVGMDDEALRVFQIAGVAEALLDDVIQNVSLRMFTAKGELFADIRPETREYGWYRRNIFMQQLAEATLREHLTNYPHVRMRLGSEVSALRQDEKGVTLTVTDRDGVQREIEAQYCVAADGGRSTLRDLVGVTLVGNTHPIKWLVVDVRNAELDAPYTALHCDPRRPNVCIHLPFGYRRWEFMVFPHEDAERLVDDASVKALIAPYVKNADDLEVVRARIYTHHSRVADRFVVGRTLFAGDAAHLSPPWIGQGLNLGLRDAGNIAWKLASVIKGQADPGILVSYETERRDHAKAMIDLADTFGRVLMPTNSVKAFVRDVFFKSIGSLSAVRNYVLQMKFKPMPRYDRGLIVEAASDTTHTAVGRMFIQPEVEAGYRKKVKFDDVLGPWFAVVGWRTDPYESLDEETRAFWQSQKAVFVRVERSRSGASRNERLGGTSTTLCVEDLENALEPWFQQQGHTIAIIRPDRYVAALADPFSCADVTRVFAAKVGAKDHELEEA